MRITTLFLLFTLSLISCKKEKKAIENTDTEIEKTSVNQGKHCFFSKIENNQLILEATIDKDSVYGNYDYYPEKGKPNKGIFKGVLNGNVANTVCKFTQNNKTIREELVFKMDKNKASILGGEKKEINGVWRFIDKSKGIYMNDLPRRNCN